MYRFSWFHALLSQAHSRNVRRRQVPQARRSIWLHLESLEDRVTPSATVLQAATVSQLQAAITTADNNPTQAYTIQLTGTSYNLTQQLILTNTAGVTIQGNGDTLTAAANSRLFLIESGTSPANVTLQNLTLTGGDPTATAKGNANGGAILDAGGNVTLSNAVVANNTVSGSGLVSGGGVFVSGSGQLTLADSTIRSNHAIGANGVSPGGNGTSVYGGGVYVSGSSTVQIRDSILRDNSAQGGKGAAGYRSHANGGSGGNAIGGGLYVNGSGWNVTLTGDTLSGNSVLGGNGGDGAAGGNGGNSGRAQGGAVNIFGNGTSLTILNDTANPSLMVNNSVQAGSSGGSHGTAGTAEGGAVFLSAAGATIYIGNTTFYGNKVSGPNTAVGGGIDFRNGNFTMVNSTVANNTVTAGYLIYGGGIADNDPQTVIFANNTIAQNTITTANGTLLGAGLSLDPAASNPTLLNNLIQGNLGIGGTAVDLDVTGGQSLAGAGNNFIGSVNLSSTLNATNIVGNTTPQLGSAIGVTADGTPSGGPIYYPLLAGTLSVGGGTTGAFSVIAAVEGLSSNATTATDAVGNTISANGPIDLGAVQFTPPSPSPSPSPSPPPCSSSSSSSSFSFSSSSSSTSTTTGFSFSFAFSSSGFSLSFTFSSFSFFFSLSSSGFSFSFS